MVKEILDLLLEESVVPVRVEVDAGRFRPAEVPLFAGSMENLRNATGWRPEREFAASVRETLAWWRALD